MNTDAVTVPSAAPPRWVNNMVRMALRTPGLQRLIGRGLALITVTGRKTGTRYTTPVSYYRDHDAVLVITKRGRTWWRNLETNADVELRLAGEKWRGRAQILADNSAALSRLATALERRHTDARALGLTFTPDGHLDQGRARTILPQLVILEIRLTGRIGPNDDEG
ncbi:MAG TPA: nitroreductase family deazaflavin-dependent oxidoreductase [Jiangellaceae bacterium]|nr:nitroreductase family deazaflavin-dependent oxidoreductase [Jiangellaceae bacterium]